MLQHRLTSNRTSRDENRGGMKILCDEPLLGRLCQSFGGSPSAGDAADLNEPLLVFAHTRVLTATAHPWNGGLAQLEKMLAQTRSEECHVAVLGFLPLGGYGDFNYLLNYYNYRRLPARDLPQLESDRCLMTEKKRNVARRRRTLPDLGLLLHDLAHCLNRNLPGCDVIGKLAKTCNDLTSPDLRGSLAEILEALRTTPDLHIRGVLCTYYNALDARKGAYEPPDTRTSP
jgi:hypothetical protein